MGLSLSLSWLDRTLLSVDSMDSFISFEEEHITDCVFTYIKKKITLLEIRISKNIVYRTFHLCIHRALCVVYAGLR